MLIVFSLFNSLSLLKMTNPPPPLYFFPLFIAWGWWSAHDYLLVSFVWVGPDLIILDKEYASLVVVVMVLELVLASERLLGSDILQGNTKLPRSQAAPSQYSPQPIHTWSAWAYLTCDQWHGHNIGFGLKRILGVCLGLGPRPSGPKATCRTITFFFFFFIFIF